MYLGASSELELRVTAPYNSQPVGKCFICRLPDEILLQILDNATIPDMPDTSKDQPRGNASAVEEFMFHSVPRSYTGESNTLTDLGNTAQYGSEDLENDESQYEEEDSAKEVTQEALPATTVPLHGKASNISLRLVCKRWQRVYDEIFFRDILIGTFDGSGGPDAGRRIRSFLTVLENRPLLQTYPRSFYIDLDKIGEIACRNAVRIVSLCKNVKSLSIHTELKTLSSSTSTWPLLEATKNLKLERLHITWPSLHLLQNLLDISSIRDISFDRFGPGIQKTDPFASWVEDDEIVHGQHSLYKPAPLMQSEVEELFPKSKDYSWGATSLRLSDPCCDPVVTEHIVRMPARLQILSLTELDTCIVSEKYTLAAVQAIIEIQRNTLQTITLSRIPNENKTMPDFTVFPALKSLTMSAYDIMQIEKPSVALQKLSGTPLRKLCLDITPEDEQEPFTIEQQTEWASWLTEFASEKQSKYPDSELEEVFVSISYGKRRSPM